MLPSFDLQAAILSLIAFILSVTVHEFGHAWVATRLGDSLPRAQNRLTLNPIQHIDPIGTLLAPILMSTMGGVGFAWGRPVQTNPTSYTRRFTRATGSLLVSVAGPIMNLLMATLISAIIIIGMRTGVMGVGTAELLTTYLVALNLGLMFFNLLPIPPLDGGSLLAWVLPRSMQGVVEVLARWGFLILLGLFLTNTLRIIMAPARWAIGEWILAMSRLAGA